MIPTREQSFSTDLQAIVRIIEEGTRFLLTTHVNADPDALGSELALAEGLRALDKKPLVLNPTAVSNNYSFLDPGREIQVYTNEEQFKSCNFDAVFIMDISRWERLGSLADPIRHCEKPKVCLDHHPYAGGFADYHLVDVNACATAEIVYDLLGFLGVPLSRRIAECLYTSMLADTGSFSFSNTSVRCHTIVAEILKQDIPSREIFEQLYQNQTPARLKLLGMALSSLQFDCRDRLAWMTITHDMLAEVGLCADDVEGFVELPRNCRSVLLSILFLEVEPEDIKISLRAKGDFNANKLAGLFGGGGHNHASGIRMFGPLPLVTQTLLHEARKAMQPFLR